MRALSAIALLTSGAALLAAHVRLQQRVRETQRVLPQSSSGHTRYLVVQGRKYYVTPNQQRFGKWGRFAGLALAAAGAATRAVPPAVRRWRESRLRD